ncbi:Uncharacterized protein TCAP_05148 [Tolypocladium capitatum]|uniref:Uncharacterized protein n=1 Tax=Tolypocladium capitatum TaxID=45235 RepID=A0A2K3QBK0_9HYPO|nr:Uncharacterized protein TCAP_05148 [Tolypocladium capitatum]
MEHVEIDWVPQWDPSGEKPENSALEEWSDRFLEGLDKFHRSGRVFPQATRRMIEEAGFVDFREQAIRCYVNPWSPDPHVQRTARWFNMGLRHCLEAMSLMPMIEGLHMTIADVKELCARVVDENTKLRFHGYCTVYVWTARRPAANEVPC